VYVSSHRLCATAGGRRFGDDSVTSIGRAEGAVASFRRDVENSFSCQNVYVVASTVIACAGAVGGAVGAGSKDMGCAR
jgi:hypothetical protein